MTLEEYFRGCFNGGEWKDGNAIDHSIRHNVEADGSVSFYIHPTGVNGATCDYVVHGNELVPK